MDPDNSSSEKLQRIETESAAYVASEKSRRSQVKVFSSRVLVLYSSNSSGGAHVVAYESDKPNAVRYLSDDAVSVVLPFANDISHVEDKGQLVDQALETEAALRE